MTDPRLELLSIDECVAELTASGKSAGVGKRTFEEWVKKREVASFKKGSGKRGVRRVTRQDLIEFVIQNTLRRPKPKWLTAQIENEFWKRMDQIVEMKVQNQLARFQKAA